MVVGPNTTADGSITVPSPTCTTFEHDKHLFLLQHRAEQHLQRVQVVRRELFLETFPARENAQNAVGEKDMHPTVNRQAGALGQQVRQVQFAPGLLPFFLPGRRFAIESGML